MEQNKFHVPVPQFLKKLFGWNAKEQVESTKVEAVDVSGRIVKKAVRRLRVGSYNKVNIDLGAYKSLSNEKDAKLIEQLKDLGKKFDARAVLAELERFGDNFDSVDIGTISK